MTIEEYVNRIDGFLTLKPSEQIPYLGYYLIIHEGKEAFTAKNIEDCFFALRLPPYSNISAYLSKEKKSKRMMAHKNGGYRITKLVESEISNHIGELKANEPSENYFPLELLHNTRSYLIKTAKQAIQCYDYQFYDACLVMTRRLIETLIIELFERYKIKERIQDKSGNYFFCSDLIDCLLSEKVLWTIGRNSAKALPDIKAKGDLCAHNRRFNATKSDADSIKLGLRIVVEELVHLIDYEHWNKESKK
ncbi:hypothetical protein [Bacteroides sp. L008]|uniref:hypothetical protein n=1 Tax=Bacteroides sp. L008 TaxID=3162404 RepID=UPI003465ACE6